MRDVPYGIRSYDWPLASESPSGALVCVFRSGKSLGISNIPIRLIENPIS
jgi:hypothetical protein